MVARAAELQDQGTALEKESAANKYQQGGSQGVLMSNSPPLSQGDSSQELNLADLVRQQQCFGLRPQARRGERALKTVAARRGSGQQVRDRQQIAQAPSYRRSRLWWMSPRSKELETRRQQRPSMRGSSYIG